MNHGAAEVREQASSRELNCRCGDDDHDGIYHEVTEVNGGNDDE